jgi:ketosteroid isomerase-like protein
MDLDQSAEQAVLAVQQQFWQALETGDRALFESVFAPDFVARSPDAPNMDREAFIALLTSFPGTIHIAAPEGLEIRLFDHIAVLTGTQIARVHLPNSKGHLSKVMLTNIFRQAAGQWQMVLSHAVELTDLTT